ncbi:hypothetical protein BDY19DRAFT_981016, partial [Irpex rosettiformis]
MVEAEAWGCIPHQQGCPQRRGKDRKFAGCATGIDGCVSPYPPLGGPANALYGVVVLLDLLSPAAPTPAVFAFAFQGSTPPTTPGCCGLASGFSDVLVEFLGTAAASSVCDEGCDNDEDNKANDGEDVCYGVCSPFVGSAIFGCGGAPVVA